MNKNIFIVTREFYQKGKSVPVFVGTEEEVIKMLDNIKVWCNSDRYSCYQMIPDYGPDELFDFVDPKEALEMMRAKNYPLSCYKEKEA